MGLIPFPSQPAPRDIARLSAILAAQSSIEVMPRTAAKVSDFGNILPAGTMVFIAHIQGTGIDDMVATARRLRAEGMDPVPHIPARLIADAPMLRTWLTRYRDAADVRQALVLAGGVSAPAGAFENSMQLLETGAFDQAGIRDLFVAGHPEGNRDIDTDGSERAVMAAARWKAAFAERSDARMALVTQFAFEAAPIIDWMTRLRAEEIDLPVHVGLAGPAKLQTLIRFAVACGVGPSIRVLQRRAKDVTKLLVPVAPDALVRDLAAHKAAQPDSPLAGLHLFPLGGIAAAARWRAELAADPRIETTGARGA